MAMSCFCVAQLVCETVSATGGAGSVIFFGPAKECVAHLADLRSPRMGGRRLLDPANYDNPGDYIIDVIGLDPEKSPRAGESASDRQQQQQGGGEGGVGAAVAELAGCWASCEAQQQVVLAVAQLIGETDNSGGGGTGLAAEAAGRSAIFGAVDAPMRLVLPVTGQTLAVPPVVAKAVRRFSQWIEPGDFATGWRTQLWVLWSRRFRRVRAEPWLVVTQFVQNCVIVFGVSLAFSYEEEDPTRNALRECDHHGRAFCFLRPCATHLRSQYLLTLSGICAQSVRTRP
jgi:hypothetical protein